MEKNLINFKRDKGCHPLSHSIVCCQDKCQQGFYWFVKVNKLSVTVFKTDEIDMFASMSLY